jgi:hypothetical protein
MNKGEKMWKNKKHGKQLFAGSYERDKKGERIFVLTGTKGRRIVFESYQAAKKDSWVKA